MIINSFVKNLPHFFEADCKGKGSTITSQFLLLLLFTFAAHSTHNLQRTSRP
jgi:hypothetical protein